MHGKLGKLFHLRAEATGEKADPSVAGRKKIQKAE